MLEMKKIEEMTPEEAAALKKAVVRKFVKTAAIKAAISIGTAVAAHLIIKAIDKHTEETEEEIED